MEHEEEVHEKPQLAFNYLLNYKMEWRGGRSAITTSHLQQIINFVDKYFDLMKEDQYLRKQLKTILNRIQDDVKLDNKTQQQQLNSLFNRDKTLIEEDLHGKFENK